MTRHKRKKGPNEPPFARYCARYRCGSVQQDATGCTCPCRRVPAACTGRTRSGASFRRASVTKWPPHLEHVVMVSMLLSTNFTRRQARVTDSRGSIAAGRDLLAVELVGLHDGVDVFQCADLGQVLVDVEEQRSVDVGLPGQEPVGREGQLALGGRACRPLPCTDATGARRTDRFRFPAPAGGRPAGSGQRRVRSARIR